MIHRQCTHMTSLRYHGAPLCRRHILSARLRRNTGRRYLMNRHMDPDTDPLAHVLMAPPSARDARGRFTTRSEHNGAGDVLQSSSYLRDRAGMLCFDEHIMADAMVYDLAATDVSEPHTCSICLDTCRKSVVTTQCSHVFHPRCLRKLVVMTCDSKAPDELTCPMCRRLLLADLVGPLRTRLFHGTHWPHGIPDSWLRVIVGPLTREDWHFVDDNTGHTLRMTSTPPPQQPHGHPQHDTVDLTADEMLDEDDLAYLSEAETMEESDDPDWVPADWVPPMEEETFDVHERLRRVRRVLHWGAPVQSTNPLEPRTPPNQVVPSGVPATPPTPPVIPIQIVAPPGMPTANIVISDGTPNNRLPPNTPGISPEMHMAPLFRHVVLQSSNSHFSDTARAGPAGAVLTTFEHVLGADPANPSEQVPYARVSINLPDLLTQIANGETFRAFSPACESSMGATIVADNRGLTINFSITSLVYHYVRTQEITAHLARQQHSGQ